MRIHTYPNGQATVHQPRRPPLSSVPFARELDHDLLTFRGALDLAFRLNGYNRRKYQVRKRREEFRAVSSLHGWIVQEVR